MPPHGFGIFKGLCRNVMMDNSKWAYKVYLICKLTAQTHWAENNTFDSSKHDYTILDNHISLWLSSNIIRQRLKRLCLYGKCHSCTCVVSNATCLL